MDTLFLQFYSKQTKKDGSNEFTLNNGFSDTLLECKNRGDVIWYEHDLDYLKYYNKNEYSIRELPISKGTVYISAVYPNHLYQSYLWSKMYPNIQFNVGGPMLFGCENNNKFLFFDVNEDLPKNLYLTGKSVEQMLDIPDYSVPWSLETPNESTYNDSLKFSYTLENQCYYKKCIFCSTTYQRNNQYRFRKNMNLDYIQFSNYKSNIIRLNTGSITPYHIENMIPKLSSANNTEHYIFIRIVKKDLESFRKTLSTLDVIPNFNIGIGLEFPTKRMWRYIRKGFSFDNVLLLADICNQFNLKICLNFVIGWNNLTLQDIIELEQNLNKIPNNVIKSVRLWWLFAHHRTEIFNTYNGKSENSLSLDPFDFGFLVKVNKEQQEFNHRAALIIKNRFKNLSDFSDFTRGLSDD